MTIGGGYETANPDSATSSTMVPGSEGQGLSGDGLYENDGSGLAGPVMVIVGGPTAISGIVDVATGLYELATDKLVAHAFL